MTDDHIILKDVQNRGYIRILLSCWYDIIYGVKRPFDLLIVDKDYVLPDDIHTLRSDFGGTEICINDNQYGALLAESISLYYSHSKGLIFQVNSDEYTIDKDCWIYS